MNTHCTLYFSLRRCYDDGAAGSVGEWGTLFDLWKSAGSSGEVTERSCWIWSSVNLFACDFMSRSHPVTLSWCTVQLQGQWEAREGLWMSDRWQFPACTRHPACLPPSFSSQPPGSTSSCWITREQPLMGVDSLSDLLLAWPPVDMLNVLTFTY